VTLSVDKIQKCI